MYNIENLKKDFENNKNIEFLYFWGHRPRKDGQIGKSCFSQWWECQFIIDDIKYYTAEQYMMAEKARLFKDFEILEKILSSKSAKEIKDFGRKIKNFNEELWSKEKINIVKRGNLAKFSQNESLKYFLLNTDKKILVEASPYDKIWGIGLIEDDEKVKNPNLWEGLNLLGFILMELREELKNCLKELGD